MKMKLSIDANGWRRSQDRAEEGIQITFVDWCRAQARTMPEVAEVFHIPNYRHLPGTARQRVMAISRLRKLGFTDGYPDLAWDYARGKWHGLRIELKTPQGKVTDGQAARIALLLRRDYYTAVCVGFEAATWLAGAYWRATPLHSGRFPRTAPVRKGRRPPHELVEVGRFEGSRVYRCAVCAAYGTTSGLEVFRCKS